MNSKIELEQGIIKMTTSIWKNYPELAKYITEMPIHISENESVNMKNLQDYYNSLEKLNSEYSKTHKTAKDQIDSEKSIYSDLHLYPKSEDIYEKFKEISAINPEDLSKNKTPNEAPDTANEKAFIDDVSGSDLDVPGAELDDLQESLGSEDEENNYYSLGGDNHNDLEENNE
jgi:hypothetical protein